MRVATSQRQQCIRQAREGAIPLGEPGKPAGMLASALASVYRTRDQAGASEWVYANRPAE